MSHSVLLCDFDPENLDALTRAVAAVYGLLAMDAQQRLRHGWGFLERDAPAERARQIVAALAERGARAQAIANDALRQPGEPLVMTGFAVEAAGFTPQLQSPTAERRLVAWHELAMVAAGGFSEEIMRREAGKSQGKGPSMVGIGIFLVTGIPIGIFPGRRKKELKPVKTTRFISFGQFVTSRGESLFFNPEHFDFSGLGAAKQVNASLNFRAVVGLAAGNASARLNLGARCVLGNKSISSANYQGLHDFETELLWMMNA